MRDCLIKTTMMSKMTSPSETKHCSDCNDDLPISEFDCYFIKSRNYHRISPYCKACRRIRTNKSSKAYYRNHRDDRLEYQKKARETEEYKAKHREYKKNQRENLKDCIVIDGLARRLNVNAEAVRSIPGLIEVERNRLLLHRKINNNGQK